MSYYVRAARLWLAERILPRTHRVVRMSWSHPGYITLSPEDYRWLT